MILTMTNRQRRELTWPLVALAGIGAGFLIAIFALIPKDAPEMRTALLGVVMTGVGGVVTIVLRSMERRLENSQHQRPEPPRQEE